MKSANDLMWIYGRRKLNGGDTPSRVRLPPGYTEVDAISSNKYVDTGFVADPSDEWIVTCRMTGSSANLPVMGGGYSKTDFLSNCIAKELIDQIKSGVVA